MPVENEGAYAVASVNIRLISLIAIEVITSRFWAAGCRESSSQSSSHTLLAEKATHKNNSDRKLLDPLVEPGNVRRSGGVSSHNEIRRNAVDEAVEDGRNVCESGLRVLRNEATCEREGDGRLGEEDEGCRRRCWTDDGVAERVDEADCRKGDSDGGRVRKSSLEDKRDSASGVVGGKVKVLDSDEPLEAVHSVEDNLRRAEGQLWLLSESGTTTHVLRDRDAANCDSESRNRKLLAVDLPGERRLGEKAEKVCR